MGRLAYTHTRHIRASLALCALALLSGCLDDQRRTGSTGGVAAPASRHAGPRAPRKAPAAPKSVAALCLVDSTGWWDENGAPAKEWLNNRLIPWLRAADTLGLLVVGNAVGDDRALVLLESLPGLPGEQYDTRFLAARRRLADTVAKLKPPPSRRGGTALWEIIDQAATILSGPTMRSADERILFCLTDFAPDGGETLDPRQAPTVPFPEKTKGVMLFLPRRGLDEQKYAAMKDEIVSKLASVNVTLALPPMGPVESKLCDPNQIVKRSTSLW